MRSTFFSKYEYDHILSEIEKSSTRCIVYEGLLIQDVGCDSVDLVCAVIKDVYAGSYEWKSVKFLF